MLYISRTTNTNFSSSTCLIKCEFEEVLICCSVSIFLAVMLTLCLFSVYILSLVASWRARRSAVVLTSLQFASLGVMETPKNTRTQNWSKDEVLMLLRLIRERKDTIKGKFTATLTIRHKREAWPQITEALNAAFPGRDRQKEQVEKKWQNLLCKVKKDISARRRLYNQTGSCLCTVHRLTNQIQ